MRRAVTVLAVALALGGPGLATSVIAPAWAQGATQPEGADQVQLTPKDVENFLASYPALQQLAQQLEAKYGAPQTTDEDDPAGIFGSYLGNEAARAEIEGTVKRFGFASFDAWQRVANSIAIAYGALADEGAAGGAQPDVDKEVEAIRKDPNLTDEQKEARISELTEQLGALNSFKPLPGNVDVVRPFEARLKPVLESE